VRFISPGDFLPLAGGTLTGPLTISANAAQLLTLNRPDGAAHQAVRGQIGGVSRWDLTTQVGQPYMNIDDPGVASRLTLDMATGLLGTALIPLSRLRVDEQTAENAGAVTVLVGTTTVVSLASMTVAVGDRIVCLASITSTKGATGGISLYEMIQTAGTAVVVAGVNKTNLVANNDRAAGGVYATLLSGVLQVTGAGTLTLSVRGTSAGSNETVGIGFCDAHALVLRG
jgi:hypothetical protein